jgi:UDP-N-acetyl-D-mannosaminuronic acid transferase (WecB/TagA/CpsF family)
LNSITHTRQTKEEQVSNDNAQAGQPLRTPIAWREAVAVAERLKEMSHERGVSVTWLNHWSVWRTDWSALQKVDLVGVDGTLLQMILRPLHGELARSSADTVIPRYLDLVPGARIALIGARPGVAEAAARRLEGVVLAADGYSEWASLSSDLNRLAEHEPEVVVLGLGPGLQDTALGQVAAALPRAVVFTAGGWIDQLSRSEQYFPPAVHALRLGWLWRIMREPRRLAHRYTSGAVHAWRGRSEIRDQVSLHLRPSGRSGFHGVSALTPSVAVEPRS